MKYKTTNLSLGWTSQRTSSSLRTDLTITAGYKPGRKATPRVVLKGLTAWELGYIISTCGEALREMEDYVARALNRGRSI